MFILWHLKKIIWRLSFFLIGANGSLLYFFVWSPEEAIFALKNFFHICKSNFYNYLITYKCVVFNVKYLNSTNYLNQSEYFTNLQTKIA